MLRQKKPIFKDNQGLDIAAYMGPRRAGKHIWEGEYGKYPLDPEEGYPSFFTDEIFELYRSAGLNILLPEGDSLALRAFLDSVRNGTNTPIDVYDIAAWMSVTCLSEQSIAIGSAPVPFPDFTNGK